jgi:hypothetical protein
MYDLSRALLCVALALYPAAAAATTDDPDPIGVAIRLSRMLAPGETVLVWQETEIEDARVCDLGAAADAIDAGLVQGVTISSAACAGVLAEPYSACSSDAECRRAVARVCRDAGRTGEKPGGRVTQTESTCVAECAQRPGQLAMRVEIHCEGRTPKTRHSPERRPRTRE